MWMCALKPVNTDKKKQQHEQLNSLSLLNKHCLKWIQFVSHGLAGFIFLWNPIYTLLLCEINFQVHLMSHFAVIYTAFSAIGSSLFVYFVLLVTFTLSFVIRLVVFFMVTPHIIFVGLLRAFTSYLPYNFIGIRGHAASYCCFRLSFLVFYALISTSVQRIVVRNVRKDGDGEYKRR